MKVSQEFIDKLNLLLARSRDAQKGYIETAQNINNAELRRWMLEYADQRLKFSVELETLIRSLGGSPNSDTSLLGDLHRVWIDLKGSFSDDEPLAMLKECHRGETTAFEDYDAIMKESPNMPIPTYNTLNDHKSKIKGAIAQIEAMMKVMEPVES